MNLKPKYISVEDRKIRALLFAHSFETRFGFGFGLASYLTKPESALRKHPANNAMYVSLPDSGFLP